MSPGKSCTKTGEKSGNFLLVFYYLISFVLLFHLCCCLLSDYSNLGASSNVSKSDGSYLAPLLQYHKDAFYNAYTPIWEHVQNRTHLISNAKYEKILRIMSSKREKDEAPLTYKYCQQYSLHGNIEGCTLYWNNLVVTTFEQVFDVMLEVHAKILHARAR
jgi:hypothetical protein